MEKQNAKKMQKANAIACVAIMPRRPLMPASKVK
jgi:hypothetical protein